MNTLRALTLTRRLRAFVALVAAYGALAGTTTMVAADSAQARPPICPYDECW